MSTELVEFRRGVVRPIECLQEGWRLIKDQYWLFVGIIAVGMIVGSAVPLGILLGPMMCGIYLCLFRRMRGEPVAFEMLFKGFDHFGDSLIVSLVQIVPMFVVGMCGYSAFFIGMMSTMTRQQGRGGGQAGPAEVFGMMGLMMGSMLFVVLVMMLVAVFFLFAYPLIVDRKLPGIEAIKTSFRAVAGNFGGLLGLLLVNGVLAFLGLLLCYVGALLVLPIGFAAQAVAYQRVFRAGDWPGPG